MKKPMTEKGKIKLCAVQGCCPEVDFSNPGKVILTDDYGGKVTLKKKEWNFMKKNFFVKKK